MTDTLEPWSARERSILNAANQFEPPLGAEQRVFDTLQASIAATLVSPPTAAPTTGLASQGLVATKMAVAISGAMLVVGTGAGVMLGRTLLAPELPTPQVIERVVRVEVPMPIAPSPEPEMARIPPAAPPLKKAPAARSEPPPEVQLADEQLARERELIDTARSALLHADAVASIAALETHQTTFPKGRLDEERESLWVQALVMKGALNEARAKALQFHAKFPRSLLGPTVDAALVDGP
jgi:hypothetical protein